MKTLPNQIHLLQILLICFASGIALLGLVFLGQDVTFWPNLWGYIEHGTTQLPVILGVVPFTHVAFFLSYLALYLAFEFYGFKSGFYGILGCTVVMGLSYFLFAAVAWWQTHEGLAFLPRSILAVLDHDRVQVYQTLLSFALGGITAFSLAGLIRKLTKDYFMFLRYPLASILGLGLFSMVQAFLAGSNTITLEDRLLYGITPAVQFAVAVLATLIPLYFARLFLGIFKGSFSNDLATQPPNQSNTTPTDTSAPIAANEEETTASQKIHSSKIA